MPTITIRGVPEPHDGQQEAMNAVARFVLVVAGRRWGKSTFGIVRALQKAGQGAEAMWTAPTYSMARIGWDPLRHIGGQVPGAQVRLADRELWLPGSGGRILVRSADRPDSMRGHGLDFAVLDEAAYCKPEVWHEVLRPALADRQGEALFLTTPNGLNWLWELWESATSAEWARLRMPTWTNPFIPQAEINEMRDQLGSLAFLQEIEAEFVEAGAGLIDSGWLRYATLMETEDEDGVPQLWLRAGDETARLDHCSRFAVVDPAISQRQSADYTAIATVAVTPKRQLVLLSMLRDRIDAPSTIRAMHQVMQRWQLDWIGVEDVSYQRSLIQYARREGLPVRALQTGGQDKVARAMPLIARLEAGTVWLLAAQPWIAELERELMAFPAGAHDDQVDALAYAARSVYGQGIAMEGALGV